VEIFKLFSQALDMLDRCTWNSRIDRRFEDLDFNLCHRLTAFLMHGFWGFCLSSAKTTIAVETPMALEEFSLECEVFIWGGILVDEFCAGWDEAGGADGHHVADEGA
jgi:hypothetical protein